MPLKFRRYTKNGIVFCNQLPSPPGVSATLRRAVASAMGSGFIPPVYTWPTPLHLNFRGSIGPAFCTRSVHVSRSEGAFLGFFFCTSKRRNCPRGISAYNRILGECMKKGRGTGESPAIIPRRSGKSPARHKRIQSHSGGMHEKGQGNRKNPLPSSPAEAGKKPRAA